MLWDGFMWHDIHDISWWVVQSFEQYYGSASTIW
jgi:hypothetical protein